MPKQKNDCEECVHRRIEKQNGGDGFCYLYKEQRDNCKVFRPDKKAIKVVVEIEKGMISDIHTSAKEDDVDVYVVDWDAIELGESLPELPESVHAQTDIDKLFNQMRKRHENLSR